MPPSNHPSTTSVRPSRRVRRNTASPTKETAPDPLGAAVRLLSETAHDLKSPLAGIAATMEVIRDGSLGDVTPSQAEFLRGAMNQCRYIDSLIGELARAERLRSGTPRVRRVATKRSAIRESVELATRSILSNKQIDLLWDGVDPNSADVLIDPTILTRLLTNLIINAERASQAGSPILIRVEDDLPRGVAVWSVIDRGRGIAPQRLQQISGTNSIESDLGGEGLGLMIARQMASLHYSSLTLRSRVGSGTDAMFETPLATPSGIATTFARFRSLKRGGRSRPKTIQQWKSGPDVAERELLGGKRVRIETVQNQSSWHQIQLHCDDSRPTRPDRLALGRVTADEECSMEMADRFDEMLQDNLSQFELAYRTSRRSWVCAFDADHHSMPTRMQQIESLSRRATPAMHLQWSEPSIVPVHERSLQCLLLDAMTTRSLAEAPGIIPDVDSVRLGTPEITFSPVASARLDEELRRMNQRMKTQSERLQQQSASLRPQG
ncbi:two-component signal transduction [Rhodopirellula islandica]|uniref:histidine kinase n=1 Tax=Rhodopirellula islandica TaxID=595434 RepID=A0A0J1EFS7_RHOIS|nr:HAMP domain-containing sensor histidine kinase [Rhodopirellula islandica]KLU04364.1 two-component signal transduction [Rhodopirellula islandica]